MYIETVYVFVFATSERLCSYKDLYLLYIIVFHLNMVNWNTDTIIQ
jgi:hypothetical protein